jgi:hypothetical protein
MAPPDGNPAHPNAGVRCDFCSRDNPAWRYPCKPFIVNEVDGLISVESPDDWAACDTCRSLIDHGDWGALETRSVMTANVAPHMQLLLRPHVRALHAGFRKYRTGSAVRVR